MLNYDLASVNNISNTITLLLNRVTSAVGKASMTHMSGAFSAVPGLDQLGAGHGVILNGGLGSAATVLKSFAEQLAWIQQNLASNAAVFNHQDLANTIGLVTPFEAGIAEEQVLIAPNRPAPRFDPLNPVHAVVGPATSVDQLAAAFAATRLDQAELAAAAWMSMSTDLAGIADKLLGAAADLVGANEGLPFERASTKITEMAGKAANFAANAQAMHATTQGLLGAHATGAANVYAAQNVLHAMPPKERIAAERTYLQSFPATFQPAISAVTPRILNLMDPMLATAGGVMHTGIGEHAKEFTSQADAAWRAARSVASPQTTIDSAKSTMNQVAALAEDAALTNPAALAAPPLGGPATGIGAAAPTMQNVAHPNASTAAPLAAAPTVAPNPAGMAAGPHGGLGRAVTAPSSLAPAIQRAPGIGVRPAGPAAGTGISPALVGTGTVGQPALSKAQALDPRLTGPQLAPATAVGHSPSKANAATGHALNARPVSGSGTGGRGTGLPGGLSRGISHTGLGPIGGISGGPTNTVGGAAAPKAMGGFPGAIGAGTATGGTGSPGTLGSAGGSRSAVPVAPMMGAGGAGPKNSKGSAKTVTSAVETTPNKRKLLGKPTPVVPGVIGAWVRG